uniref:Putative secreted protein n=1 Tax=Amblyomma americanum TaxID=6943 RepID=A0A0C9RVT8_AMBAM
MWLSIHYRRLSRLFLKIFFRHTSTAGGSLTLKMLVCFGNVPYTKPVLYSWLFHSTEARDTRMPACCQGMTGNACIFKPFQALPDDLFFHARLFGAASDLEC